MCQWGANRNPWADYQMSSFPTPTYPNQRVVERPDHHCGDDLVAGSGDKERRDCGIFAVPSYSGDMLLSRIRNDRSGLPKRPTH